MSQRRNPSETTEVRELVIRKAISDLIRTQRKRQSPPVTQEKLAQEACISFEHLNHIENYKATASIEVLERIARALGHHRLSEFLALDEKEIL